MRMQTDTDQTPHMQRMVSLPQSNPQLWQPPSTSQGVPARGRVAGQSLGSDSHDHSPRQAQTPSGYTQARSCSDDGHATPPSTAPGKLGGQLVGQLAC
jgi:hypothetical protein